MSLRVLLLAWLGCLVAAPVQAQRPVRFSVGLGASRIGFQAERPAPVTVAGLVAASAQLISGLRLSAEVTHVRFMPEVDYSFSPLDRDATAATSGLAGLEWQPPERSIWGPFIHIATGVMRIAEGDARGYDINSGGFTIQGRTRTVSAWAAGVGVRKDPSLRGRSFFVDSRYMWTIEVAETPLHQVQLLGGVAF